MNNNYRPYIIPALVLVVLCAIAAGLLYSAYAAKNVITPDREDGTVITVDPNATSTTAKGYTIERIDDAPRLVYPAIERVVPASSKDLSESSRAQVIASMEKVKKALGQNPRVLTDWLVLGVYRQMLGDYAGASEVWEFVSVQAPQEGQSFENLANLYAVHLKDSVKAELNYKKAVAADPENPAFARALAEFYQVAGKTAQAEAALKAGIASAPKAYDLQVLLARLYRDLGRTAEARTTYETLIAAAKALPTPNPEFISSLESELSTLK